MARNRELGRLAAACAALTAVTAGIGFVCLSPWAGLLVLAATGGLCALFRRATRARYRALAELSEEIDRVYRMYPHLNDDDFVRDHLSDWME